LVGVAVSVFLRTEKPLECILRVSAFVEGMQAGFLDPTAIFGLRRSVGKVIRRGFFRGLRHAVGIMNRAIEASQARLRIVVVQPREARGIGATSVPACLGIAGDTIEIVQIGGDAGPSECYSVRSISPIIFCPIGVFALPLTTISWRIVSADSFGGAGSQRPSAPH
jgi:hypothetical protein